MTVLHVVIPPLSLWLRAVAVFGLLFAAGIWLGFAVGAPPSQAFLEFNQQRLEEFRTRHGSKQTQSVRVVMLGNSRLKNATIDATLLDQLAARDGSKRAEIFRLVANWAVFRDFEPFLDDLDALEPDVYVVQMDLLVEETATAFERHRALRYLRWLTSGTGPWTWYEPVQEQLDLVCTTETEPDMRAMRAESHLKVDPNGESPRLAQSFVRRAAASGTRVLLVSVPKSTAFETVLPSASWEMLASSRRLAAETSRVAVAAFTDTLSDDHFCDVTHLNRKGAEAYSRWLIEQLASVQLAAER